MSSTLRQRVTALLAGALAASALVGVPATSSAAGLAPSVAVVRAAPSLQVGRPAWVAVSVATVWRTTTSPNPVDQPALERPARIVQWLNQMTLAQRRSLWHRADTQALLGDRVRVVALRPGWARVVIPNQPSQLDPRGYPGWVPRRQLSAVAPAASTHVATVVTRTASLRTDQAEDRALFPISYGTRLPYLGTVGRRVRVALPGGITRRLPIASVRVHQRTAPALPASPRALVRMALGFRGLPYLWAGLSGFGFDCSGLTWMDYRVHGIQIPRDALPQSRAGRHVRRADLRRGDLLFYATDGVVHHVAMYVGNGNMVHAPRTGRTVEVVPMSTPAYAREYAGARRYLP